MKDILIIGAGGQARVALDFLESDEFNVVGLLDDNESLKGKKIDGVEVLGKIKDVVKFKEKFDECFIAFGDNELRYNTVKLIKNLVPSIKFATIKHPSTIIAKNVIIGQGTIVGAGAIICTDAEIGEHNIINDGAIVEHECILGDFANIGPGAKLASAIIVGEKSFIGMGSCIIEDTRIGKNSIIGAGAIVLKDIPDNVVAVGIPAKVKKKNE